MNAFFNPKKNNNKKKLKFYKRLCIKMYFYVV